MSKTRRELFTSLFSSVSDRTRDVRASSSTKGAPELLWPPGALEPSDAFLAACTGCGDCIEACPADALFTIERADGTPLPVIDPVRQPCLLCDDIPCIPACPRKGTGADRLARGHPYRHRQGQPRHLHHLPRGDL
jgi:ferredoxin